MPSCIEYEVVLGRTSRTEKIRTRMGSTHVADNVADKNISNIPMNVADILEMLLICLECC